MEEGVEHDGCTPRRLRSLVRGEASPGNGGRSPAMAAPPSPPPPPNAMNGGGDTPLSLFLDTDLGTRFALLVAPDTIIRRLKSLVAAEHAVAFPDIGPVTVKSFQVHRKGALYQLSESMTVTRIFPRVKAEYFLHVKMAEVVCQGTPEIDGRRKSEGHVGINLQKHLRELPAAIPEVANDGLARGHEGAVLNNGCVHDAVPDNLLPSLSQINTESKNEAQDLVSDADITKSSKQTNASHVMESDAKEDFLHSNREYDIDGDASGNKQTRIEDTLGQGHAVDDIYLRKERKKAKRTDYTSATDPGITNESKIIDTNKSIRALLETNPTDGEHSNTSFAQEVSDTIPEGSLQKETPSTAVKKKKRKRRELASPKAVSGQENTKLQSGAVGLSESGADAYEVDLTNRDGSKARSPVFLLPSEPCNESQGGRCVQVVSNAQACTDMTSGQGNSDHAHDGDCIPSIENAINSAGEVAASAGKITEGSSDPWDGGEKHQDTKQSKYNEDSHEGDVAAISNMEKDGKNIDALEEKPTNNNTKKRKKVKKVSTVDRASMDAAGDKQILRHTENAGKTDKVCVEREILDVPSVGPISHNVQQRDSNVIENRNGDGKRKKKKICKSESLKKDDPNQNQTKSSEHDTHGCSIHNASSAPQDAKQATQVSVEESTVGDNKFAENTIAKVLADLKSRDSVSNELSENLLKEQIHLDKNMSALELTASTSNKVSNCAESPSKYPEAIHSDAAARSPIHEKRKGKHLIRLTAMNSSDRSFGMNEEDAETKSKESDTLRFSDKTSDLKDVFIGDIVEQDHEKNISTKRQIKKVKKVRTDKITQYLDEQVNQVAKAEMEGVDASIQTDLFQGGSVIDTAKADTRLKESDTLRFSGKTSVSKDVFTGDIVQQDDGKTKSTKRQKKKVKKVPTNNTTKSFDEQVNQVAREDMEGVNASIQADFVQGGSVNDTALKTVAKIKQKSKRASKSQAPKIQEANHSTHTAKDSLDVNAISTTGTYDDEHASGYPTELPIVLKDSANLKSSSPIARKERKKHLETQLRSWDSAMDHDLSAGVVRYSVENDLVSPKNSSAAFEANCCIEAHPASDKINLIGSFSMGKINDRLDSAENIQNNEDEIMEAENTKSDRDITEPKEFEKSTSQKKAPVSNLVKSFAMSPTASSDSTEDTPQRTNRFITVRKVSISKFMNMQMGIPKKRQGS